MLDGTLHTESKTTRPANVRLATPADEQAILAMTREGHAENGIFSYDSDKILAMIQKATQQKGGLIGVIDGDDALAASVCLILDSYWYTKEWCLTEVWAFVSKPYRSRRYYDDLVDFSKWCADDMGLPLGMGIMSTHRTEAKVRLYKRKLTQIGANFMHSLEKAHGPVAIELGRGKAPQ